jgi:hypothetical protein
VQSAQRADETGTLQSATFDSLAKGDALVKLCRKAPELFAKRNFFEQSQMIRLIEQLRRESNDLDLGPAFYRLLSSNQNLLGDLLAEIVFSAILTNFGRNPFEDHGRTAPLQGDCDFSLACVAVFAQNALHWGLLVL